MVNGRDGFVDTRMSWEQLRGDLFGGITSAVVSLPMALAFGVVSGLGSLAGLYGAIAVGFSRQYLVERVL